MRTTLIFAVLPIAALAACSTIPEETTALLEQPIDCSTAEADIAALEAAKPSAMKRVRSGVRSVTPVGLASGIATRDLNDRVDVASGELGRDLDDRIEDIEEACGVESSDEANAES